VCVTGVTSACGEEGGKGVDGNGRGRFSGVLNDRWEVWRRLVKGRTAPTSEHQSGLAFGPGLSF